MVWSKIWATSSCPKVVAFLWLMVKGHILTWDKLLKRGFEGPSLSPLYKSVSENISHLLDSCHYSSVLRDKGAEVFWRTNRGCNISAQSIATWDDTNATPPGLLYPMALSRFIALALLRLLILRDGIDIQACRSIPRAFPTQRICPRDSTCNKIVVYFSYLCEK